MSESTSQKIMCSEAQEHLESNIERRGGGPMFGSRSREKVSKGVRVEELKGEECGEKKFLLCS